MRIDLNLPKKLYENNYFEKLEKGCRLISFSLKNRNVIECELPEFEIDKNFCVNDKSLNMLNVLENPEIKVGTQFVIKSKKGTYRAKLLDTKPNSIERNYTKEIRIETKRLAYASKFTSDNDARLALTGVCVSESGNVFSSDSFTAYRFIGENVPKENDPYIILPSDFVDLICKECGETVTLEYNDNVCSVAHGGARYITPLIIEKFPNFNRLYDELPSYHDITFDKKELEQIVAIAKQCGTSIENQMLVVSFTEKEIGVFGDNDYQVEIFDTKNLETYNFALTIEHLARGINFIKEDKVIFKYKDFNLPIFVEEDRNQVALLPIRNYRAVAERD